MKKSTIISLGLFFCSFAHSQSFEDLIAKGDSSFRIQNYEEASDIYSDAIHADPSQFDGFFRRGQAYFYLQRDSLAISDYDKALELNPGDHRILHLRGKAKRFSGDLGGALEDLDEAIRNDSSYVPAYVDRAYAFVSTNQWAAAWIYFNLAIEMEPDQPAKVYMHRGYAFQLDGAYIQAIDDYKMVIALDPTNSAAYLNAANCSVNISQFQEALAYYDSAAQLNPQNDKVLTGRGVALFNLDQVETACESWRKAVELGSATSQIHLNEYCK